jgi:hypothetical protein
MRIAEMNWIAIVTVADRDSYPMTDKSMSYVGVGREFAGHGTVNHSIDEYVRRAPQARLHPAFR